MSGEHHQFHYKNNRLQQLRGFCYAAQFGNISRAAEHMGLTHSSVSVQIKTLSKDLGVALFKRRGPKVTLTHEGEKLLDLALPLLDTIERLHETFHHELDATKKTELRIAANSTTLNFILPNLAKKYLAAYPDTYFTVHYAEQEEAIKKLLNNEVDFALLPRREHKPFPKGYDYIPLFYYTPSLITCPDHPLAGRKKLSVQEISKYELTLPTKELRVIPNLYDIFPQHDINKKLRINFVNWETTRKYIEAGLVISISSDIIIGKDDTLVATPLPHLFPVVDYGFVQRRDGCSRQKKVSVFIEMARVSAS